jgi:hypothetical protein
MTLSGVYTNHDDNENQIKVRIKKTTHTTNATFSFFNLRLADFFSSSLKCILPGLSKSLSMRITYKDDRCFDLRCLTT